MSTATMTTSELLTLNASIGNQLDAVNVATEPEKARELIKARRDVRNALEARHVAASN